MAGNKAKGGKKNRKFGRNKASCERYRKEGRREKNKARKQARHQRRMARQTGTRKGA